MGKSRRDVLRYSAALGGAAVAAPTLGTLAGAAPAAAQEAEPVTKTASTFYTAAKVAAARRNIASYDWARALRDAAVAKADLFLAKSDEWLWSAATTQGLPRGYAVNQTLGSPITGKDIYRFGNYPWLADAFNRPWKMVDPSVPEGDPRPRVYPTNDFEAFYRSGLDEHGNFDRARADRSLLVNTLYPEMGPTWGVDDGYGWVDDDGNRWTFVAYYNHWFTWLDYRPMQNPPSLVEGGLVALRDAFVYTGDLKYAHAGLILLDRVADLYPAMDTAPYHREDGFLNSDGGTLTGKVVGCIWETGMYRNMVSAYDAFFPAIATADEAGVLPFLSAKAQQYGLNPKNTVEDLKRNIHDGLLRQGYPAVKGSQIRGNFGTHQAALAMAAVVHDHPTESKEWIDFVFATGGLVRSPSWHITGGNVYTTLVDDVDRDGMGNEAAPGYNKGWVAALRSLAEILDGYAGYPSADLYEHPKYRKMFNIMYSLTLLNQYTPPIGDSGVTGKPGLISSGVDNMVPFARYGNPEYAQMAYLANGNKTDGLYTSIFDTDVEGVRQRIQEIINSRGPLNLPSQMLTGYGLAALRDGTGSNARDVWMYYGRNTGHGHRDTLNLGLHAFGVDLLPDLGYPEFADNGARRLEWVDNTIAHNTVIVDAAPQGNVLVGTPKGFGVGDWVQVVDVAAPTAYAGTSVYRRTTAMVKVDEANSYTVDVFRVVGGSQHHFSFHAAEGPVSTEGLALTPQPTGTYAGPDILPPADNAPARLDSPGFDWLFNVERDTDPTGPFAIDWKVKDTWNVHDPDPDLHLRLTMLTDVADVALADGIPPRNKPGNPASLRYLVARRTGDNLASQFVSVIEPYIGTRVVRSARTVPVEVIDGQAATHEVTAVRVELANGRIDYVISSLRPETMLKVDGRILFRGSFGVHSERAGTPVHAFSHDATVCGPVRQMQRGYGAVTGRLADFSRDLRTDNRLTITVGDQGLPDPTELIGSYVYIDNDGVRNAVYPIHDARITTTGQLVLEIGDVTTIRGYLDKNDFTKGYKYDVAVGATVRIPLTRQWTEA